MPGRSRLTKTSNGFNTSRGQPERAFLVGVQFRRLSRVDRDLEVPRRAAQARAAAFSRAEDDRAVVDDFVHGPLVPNPEESLPEFRELALSAGAEIAGEFVQRRDRPDPATLIGKGKLQEIAGAVASAPADLVLVDHQLSPSQQRNLANQRCTPRIDPTPW